MDKALIAEIEKRLCGPYGSVKLRADGHELTATVMRVSARSMTYGVVLYVDGWLRSEHLKTDSEVGAKFYPLRTRQLMSPKKFGEFQKVCGKRAAAAYKKRAVYQSREFSFRSAKALMAQLKKTCNQVEIAE